MAFFTGASDSTIYKSIFSSVARDQISFFGPVNFNIIGGQSRHCQNAEDRDPSLLPPDQVHVDVGIVDVSACVTLKQTFVNPSAIAIGRTKYVFPIPARAAVCAFEMHLQDGRRIIGISKEKIRAAREYGAAVQADKVAALVEWVADDIFIISVGSIPARETVTTNLVFVMELDDDPNSGIHLQLPMFIGCRYGPQPPSIVTAQSVSAQTRLSITVDIQMSGTITGVTSPTHPEIQLIPHTTPDGDAQKTVKFESSTFLTQSFVLFVRANGLDSPRCFAELDHRDSGTVAMQLSFVLHIGIAPTSPHEYLFLVDCSGSMRGSKMETVKRAMIKILHLLPKERTFFNIFSFGGSIRHLWEVSKQCDQDSLGDAIEHVRSMDANLGGTELPGALEFVLKYRNSNISSILFVLTDGEVHTGDEAISVVTNVVARSSPEASLRVFSFGIGHNVSTAAVEGIARAGNGKSIFAIESDSIEDKCIMLLGAALPCVKDVMINWGTQTRSSTLAPNSVRLSDSDFVQFGPFPSVRQSPTRTPDIFTGIRFTVFALTTHGTIPKQVILQGTYGDPGRSFMFMVPVSSVKIFGRKGLIPLHVLSARHLINDLVEGRAALPKTISPANTNDIRRAAIVQLGEQYQLASRYTSFVAMFDETTVLPPLSSTDNQEAVGSLSRQDSPSEFRRYSIDDAAELDLRDGSEWSVGEQLEEDMNEEWEPHMRQPDADVVQIGTRRENERGVTSQEKEMPQPDETMLSSTALLSTRSSSPAPSDIDIFGQAFQAPLPPVLLGSTSLSLNTRSHFGYHLCSMPPTLLESPSGKVSSTADTVEAGYGLKDAYGGDVYVASKKREVDFSSLTPLKPNDSKRSEYDARNIAIAYTPSSAPPAKRLSSDTAAKPLSARTRSLIGLQSDEGYFVLGRALAASLGVSIAYLEAGLRSSNVGDKRSNIWATILAIKLFETKLVEERSVWQWVVDKARAWLVRVVVEEYVDIKELDKLAAEVISGK